MLYRDLAALRSDPRSKASGEERLKTITREATNRFSRGSPADANVGRDRKPAELTTN